MFQKVSGIEEFYTYEMYITVIYQNVVVSILTKVFWNNPSVFQRVSGDKKLNAKEGNRTISCQKFVA